MFDEWDVNDNDQLFDDRYVLTPQGLTRAVTCILLLLSIKLYPQLGKLLLIVLIVFIFMHQSNNLATIIIIINQLSYEFNK